MLPFLEELRSGRTLLMDGAMGTELRERFSACGSKRLQPADCCESVNLTEPELVRNIHRSYLEAGAEVLLTNTFQANPHALIRTGFGDRLDEIWQAALRLAGGQGRRHYILADIGPVQDLTPDVAKRLLDLSVSADGVLLETWTSHADLEIFTRARTASRTLLVSWTFHRNANGAIVTIANATPEECARASENCGVDAIGVNCGKSIGIADVCEIAERFHSVTSLPTFARPNAGSPGDPAYSFSADAMGEALPALLEKGVAMVGGCCGTTPDHIRRFGEWIQSLKR